MMLYRFPSPGINQLFEVGIYRILSFAVLVPVAWRLTQSTEQDEVQVA